MTESFSIPATLDPAFVAQMVARWLDSPDSVPADWAAWFASLGEDAASLSAEFHRPAWSPAPIIETPDDKDMRIDEQALRDTMNAIILIRLHRVRGNLYADLDPLGLQERVFNPELDPAHYGFGPEDWDRPIWLGGILDFERATLRAIMDRLKRTYGTRIGVEYMHIQNQEQKNWIRRRIERNGNRTDFSEEERRGILKKLTEAEVFERYLHKKFVGTKRFGIEGAETLIPAVHAIFEHATELGVAEIVLGMAHRGRLNVLANLLHKPFEAIFCEFQGNSAYPDTFHGSGDVKYHLGTSTDRILNGHRVHLSLAANPSHLEAVNPVVLGKVRAKQDRLSEERRGEILGILIHGDAAVAAQGSVAETLALSELRGFRTGGTIHIVINNQIGFTTAPRFARSSPYPSDVAKIIQAPIFHVNGDDAEAVVHVGRIAAEFRQRFAKDVFIDLFCYRRHGHSESDEPSFTQPMMYRKIHSHPSARELYAKKLIDRGTINKADDAAVTCDITSRLDDAFDNASDYKPGLAEWPEGRLAGIGGDHEHTDATFVPLDVLRRIGKSVTNVPTGFVLNEKIVRQMDAKRKMMATGDKIDWATAEALAIGSMLLEGTSVRLSGQDSGRGAFSQRHAALYDQETGARFVPLQHLHSKQADFSLLDSPLSEMGVLGFEYGYSLAEPNALVIWEAQFGDFANGAQVIIDQFITSAETKWMRMSGLTLLLPHGYEGQGPEHSSARLERFLQMCAENNIQVANITSPANYFHVLRRQMCRNFRKPLVLITPKSLLRHKNVISCLDDFGPGSAFKAVLDETDERIVTKSVRRVLLCSGKIYYDLVAERAARGITDIAILRLEQLYPFPATALNRLLEPCRKAEIVWCQEEPENMGGWHFVDRRLEAVLVNLDIQAKRPNVVARPESASTATGTYRYHVEEVQRLMKQAFV
ncbi:MAG: 2-oxoglutarate dehydrogenase E1 component [Pseudomonadota bacterium]|nr:2-oxoglutarate dehydrogenase E1 component [Pseudomonadota bacterium]